MVVLELMVDGEGQVVPVMRMLSLVSDGITVEGQ